MTSSTDLYRDCLIVYPDRTTKKGSVKHVRLQPVDVAADKIRHDMAAWIDPLDKPSLWDRLEWTA